MDSRSLSMTMGISSRKPGAFSATGPPRTAAEGSHGSVGLLAAGATGDGNNLKTWPGHVADGAELFGCTQAGAGWRNDPTWPVA
jgi:hypothetical protein